MKEVENRALPKDRPDACRAADERLLFETVIDTLPIRIFWKDRRFRYLGANRLFLRDLGFEDAETLTGKDDYTLLKSETAEVCRRGDLKVLHTGQGLYGREEKVYTAEGKELTVSMYKVPLKDEKGEIVGIVGAYVDITRLKESEKLLQESRFRLKEAQEMARLACWDMDLRNETVELSEEMSRMLGHPPRKRTLSLRTFLDHLAPDDAKRFEEALASATRSRRTFVETTCEFVKKRGERGWFNLRGQIVYDHRGDPFWLKGIVQDVTRTRLLQREAKKKEALLHHQTRLAQMGRLLENVAHQWKQPLAQINALLLELELDLEAEGVPAERFSAFFERMENLTHYMAETIETFQTHLKPHEPLGLFDPQKTLAEALRILAEPLEKHRIRVEVDWERSVPIVGSSRDLLHVLTVILENAVESLSSRKTSDPFIRIRFRTDEREGECRCRLEISDNGGGVEPSVAAQIFDPYFTTRFMEKGKGLGLYMAKMIVENRMQGTLELADPRRAAFVLSFKGVR